MSKVTLENLYKWKSRPSGVVHGDIMQSLDELFNIAIKYLTGK